MLQTTLLCLLSLLPLLATASPTNREQMPDLSNADHQGVEKLINLTTKLEKSIESARKSLPQVCANGGEYPECEKKTEELPEIPRPVCAYGGVYPECEEKSQELPEIWPEDDDDVYDVQAKDVQTEDVQTEDVQTSNTLPDDDDVSYEYER